MGTVRSLNPIKGLEEFCSFLYGEEEGFIHLPIKRPDDGTYEYDFFFKWPAQRQDVIDHVERYSKVAEVFITPGMFKSRSSSVAESHGSYVAWADFDGNVPALNELSEQNIPAPTVRVQSSIPGHEHWYWRYEQFNTDVASIQGINRALSYALEADIGAWDAGHSTRPVGSFNHKRDAPVVMKMHSGESFSLEDFASVPIPDNSYDLEQFKKEQIPNPAKTMLKYGPWNEDARDLLTKHQIPEGSRSSALARVAYTCCEQGLDNSEVYSMLQWVDRRWKKFYLRDNKEKYYVDLINYARQKAPYEGIKDVTVLAAGLEIYSFSQVLAFQDDTQWLIPGLLPAKGVGYIVGRSGTGKSTLGLGLCANLAVGKNYLDWNPVDSNGYKILYLSLEMLTEDVGKFYENLKTNYSPEEIKKLDTNFYTYSQPEKVKFYQSTSPMMGKLLRTLEDYKPDIVLIDSASFSLASNLNNQEEVTKSIEVIDMVRDAYDCAFLFIHHSRKEPPGSGYKESDLDDVFGSAFIAASAASIIALKQSKDYSEENKLMDIRYLKARFSGDNTGFSVVMDGDRRMFRRPIMGELMAGSTKKNVPAQTEKNKKNDSLFSL